MKILIVFLILIVSTCCTASEPLTHEIYGDVIVYGDASVNSITIRTGETTVWENRREPKADWTIDKKFWLGIEMSTTLSPEVGDEANIVVDSGALGDFDEYFWDSGSARLENIPYATMTQEGFTLLCFTRWNSFVSTSLFEDITGNTGLFWIFYNSSEGGILIYSHYNSAATPGYAGYYLPYGTGQWFDMAIVYDPNQAGPPGNPYGIIYYNGIKATYRTTSSPAMDNTPFGTVTGAIFPKTANADFRDLEFYTRPLTATEIKWRYNQRKGYYPQKNRSTHKIYNNVYYNNVTCVDGTYGIAPADSFIPYKSTDTIMELRGDNVKIYGNLYIFGNLTDR